MSAAKATATTPERPTADTDPSACRWCFEEACGQGEPCPYHGEAAQSS